MNCSSTTKINLDLFSHIRYCSRHILLGAFSICLPSTAFSGIFNIENTLQASLMVLCHDAQTGGFIFLRGGHAL